MTSDKPALTASTEWPERVYELQKTDPVDAGADGIDNLAPNQLAARTNYLRVKGISDWAAVWNYPDGAFCQVAGVVYRAVTANAGKPPASNPAIWTRCPMTAAEIADAINLSDKQPVDATLTALAGLNTSADRLIYATGADQFALTPLTAFIRTLLDDADAATARATLGAAPLASPSFTGIPTAPTAEDGTNTTQVATTAFVTNQAASTIPVADGTAAVGTSQRYARADHVHPTDTTRAPLASPALTGTPTAPTAAANTKTTQLATTAFLQNELARRSYTSNELSMTHSGQIIVNHMLGEEPAHVSLYLKCVVADFGYAVGDVLRIAGATDPNGSNESLSVVVTTTQFIIRVGDNGPQYIGRKDNGAGGVATTASWRLIIKASVF